MLRVTVSVGVAGTSAVAGAPDGVRSRSSLLLFAALLQPTGAPGIATATNHHVDYERLGMTRPALGHVINQPDNLYERDVALPSPGTLECKNSQKQRDP